MDESSLTSGRQKMEQVVALVKTDLAGVQTGLAKPALVETVKVEAYEATVLEVKELAAVTAPDPHSLVIKPWDRSVIAAIVKAIMKANLGVTPVPEEEIIRINVPALSSERRQELVKLVGQKVESGRAMLRSIRSEVKKEIDSRKGAPGVSEDDIRLQHGRLQQVIDEYNRKLDELFSAKEKELTEI